MSTLTLVRHGQARAFEKDSDRLTELGEAQARELGEWWRARGAGFDEVYCGCLTRQIRTAELAGFAGAVQLPAWNEYDAGGVLGTLAPRLAAADGSFAKLVEEYEAHRADSGANRYFQRMFEYIMNRWVAGDLADGGVEPWSAFQTRVTVALRRIVDSDTGGRRVLVVTSGGPIATVVQTVTGAPSRAALELNWRVRNCSVTEVLFSKGRMSLDSFNVSAHSGVITYR